MRSDHKTGINMTFVYLFVMFAYNRDKMELKC